MIIGFSQKQHGNWIEEMHLLCSYFKLYLISVELYTVYNELMMRSLFCSNYNNHHEMNFLLYVEYQCYKNVARFDILWYNPYYITEDPGLCKKNVA